MYREYECTCLVVMASEAAAGSSVTVNVGELGNAIAVAIQQATGQPSAGTTSTGPQGAQTDVKQSCVTKGVPTNQCTSS